MKMNSEKFEAMFVDAKKKGKEFEEVMAMRKFEEMFGKEIKLVTEVAHG